MKNTFFIGLFFILSSCGGGGGGGGGDAPAPTPSPTLSFTASPLSVLLNNTSTFSWSSTNTTSCTASGSNNWTGTKATSGTEDVSIDIAGNTVFTLSCSGGGGARNASVTVEGFRQTDGVVVDGYISGADVFIDENENFIVDGAENATTSDNDGKFTIKYANGSLVSIGGKDLNSQAFLNNLLITHRLDGFSDFKAITPVTSVDAFLENVDINSALGIDSSINVAVDDPVALKGDDGIYNYLYEKGNQLTILAYALQNITNDLNSTTETTQDFFKSIAEEVEAEYTETQTKVDIETEAFIAKALDNVINIKSLNIEETAKQNTLKALSGVLPIIEVKSSDDLTTSVIRFGVATLQEDIKAIANGTADEDKVESYTTDVIKYIAEDQGISSDEITPDITAIDDNSSTNEDTSITINVLANDSFITTSPISIDASNGENGTVEIAESSPPQITYSPNSHYFGNDFFSYIITQGDKTSSAEVEVDINPVNDAPSIDVALTLLIPENQTAITTVTVSDPDEDDLTLTLSGEDANSLNLTSENVLSFKEAPDFETKKTYSINLSLTDGEETVDKDISIAIKNVNDISPVFTSEAAFSAAENQIAIGSVLATDEEGDDLIYTVSGDELAISSTGVLTFVTEPDFETKTRYTATVTVNDGVNDATQAITVLVTNVNDNSPALISSEVFSVAENQTAIGTITATDADGDSITFIVSGDELAISQAGVLTFVTEPDYETKSSYLATITATDGINSTTQNITVNITNVNDIAPEFISEAIFSAAENQLTIGTITATDAEGDAINFIVSGDELAISQAGVLTFLTEPDYETKSSYLATITATDGVNTTNQDIVITINNILEDIISSEFSISDGTLTDAPVLNITIILDELVLAKKVYAALGQLSNSNNLSCSGFTIPAEELNRISSTEWSLTKKLNKELNELCRYGIYYYISLTNSETATPGEYLASGNKRLNFNEAQFSMQETKYNDPITISNNRSDNVIDKVLDQSAWFWYSPSGNYPAECDVTQFEFDKTDIYSNIESILSPLVAFPNDECFDNLFINNGSDRLESGNQEYNIYFYTIEQMSSARAYIFGSRKGQVDYTRGATEGRELEVQHAEIIEDGRVGKVTFNFTEAFLINDDQLSYDNMVFTATPLDESYLKIESITGSALVPISSSNSGDNIAPSLGEINFSETTSPLFPQRNFIKINAEFTNPDSSNGTKASPIRDIWLVAFGGSGCNSRTFYVRDELDPELDMAAGVASATIPYLNSEKGTYRVTQLNINDYGFAESNYTGYGPDKEFLSGDEHPAIAKTFVIGDGLSPTCPLFTGYPEDSFQSPDIELTIDENELFVGDFSALGSANDVITYSLEDDFRLPADANQLADMLYIDSQGMLSFKSFPDADKLVPDEGAVRIVAKSSLNNSLENSVFLYISLNNLNDSYPEIVSDSFSVAENQLDIGCVTFRDNDYIEFTKSEDFTWSCFNDEGVFSFDVQGDNLRINSFGELSFIEFPDFETKSSYDATVSITDGVNTSSKSISINIIDINDNAPIFTSSTSYAVKENQFSGGIITLSDADSSSSFSYKIDQNFEDGEFFSISSLGEISFNSSPDYESKNFYKIKAIVSDGVNEVEQELLITLIDVIAEAFPIERDLILLPKSLNEIKISLQSSVKDGRTAKYFIIEEPIYGNASLDSLTGELTYTTELSSSSTEKIVFGVDDGIYRDGQAEIIINLLSDPLYVHQWHLDNTEQSNFASTPGVAGEDLNISEVISDGHTGKGVIVSVIDEGLEILHEDLSPNVLSELSYNFRNGTSDPTSILSNGDHGTSVAGIIASKGWNNIGGRGVAPDAGLVGYNWLSYPVGWGQAYSWGLDNDNAKDIDIFNMSYGSRLMGDDDETFNFPLFNRYVGLELESIQNGVNNMRDAKGAIYVKSMGNSFRQNSTNGFSCGEEGVDDDGALSCSIRFHDALHTLPYIIGVGALAAKGVKTSYSDIDSSIWVSGMGGEFGLNSNIFPGYESSSPHYYEPAIMTTDQSSCAKGYVGNFGRYYNDFNDPTGSPENQECNYVSTFNGTSSAAPSVAGGIAVLLGAYPDLTWRDVKHIIASSSRVIDPTRSYSRNGINIYEWKKNSAGYNFHNWYGFGAFDLGAAMDYASSYKPNSKGSFSEFGWLKSSNFILDFSVEYGDAIYDVDTKTYRFIDGDDGYAKFGNANTSIYPFKLSEKGKIKFNGSAPDGQDVSIGFVFGGSSEIIINISGASKEYEIELPSEGDQEFDSLEMHIYTKNVDVVLKDFELIADPTGFINMVIPSFSSVTNTIEYLPSGIKDDGFVEFIQLKVYLDKDTPRDIGLQLISPHGTEMNVLQPFTNVTGNPSQISQELYGQEGFFIIGVSGFFGESINGKWTLKVTDYTDNGDSGVLVDWGINIYGY
jgi:serralysin